MDELWYFAHPYTAETLEGEAQNFELCCRRTAELLRAGYMLYAPVVHTHPIHVRDEGFLKGREVAVWYHLDNTIIKRTAFTGIILAPDWQHSRGCKHELAQFLEAGNKEILLYNDALARSERSEPKTL